MESPHDPGAPTDLLVEAFKAVNHAEPLPVSGLDGKDGEAFRMRRFHPRRELRRRFGVLLHGSHEQGLGFETVWGRQDGSDVVGNLSFHVLTRHIDLDVLLQVELTVLP